MRVLIFRGDQGLGDGDIPMSRPSVPSLKKALESYAKTSREFDPFLYFSEAAGQPDFFGSITYSKKSQEYEVTLNREEIQDKDDPQFTCVLHEIFTKTYPKKDEKKAFKDFLNCAKGNWPGEFKDAETEHRARAQKEEESAPVEDITSLEEDYKLEAGSVEEAKKVLEKPVEKAETRKLPDKAEELPAKDTSTPVTPSEIVEHSWDYVCEAE